MTKTGSLEFNPDAKEQQFSFVKSTKMDGEVERIERFDPGLPEQEQWQLLEVNGKQPTASELEEYRAALLPEKDSAGSEKITVDAEESIDPKDNMQTVLAAVQMAETDRGTTMLKLPFSGFAGMASAMSEGAQDEETRAMFEKMLTKMTMTTELDTESHAPVSVNMTSGGRIKLMTGVSMTMDMRAEYMIEPVTGQSVIKTENVNALVEVMYIDVANIKQVVEYSDYQPILPEKNL